MAEGIQLPALRELCRAGAVRDVIAIALAGGGFAIRVRYGMVGRTLMTQRGAVRVFASLDTVAELVHNDLGIGRISGVELADFATQLKTLRLGAMKGRLAVPGDFDAPLPDDVLSGFGGDAPPPKRRGASRGVLAHVRPEPDVTDDESLDDTVDERRG